MDSPIIVDNASEFGRNLESGFPFEDQGFGRLGDIRSQLDNLATRHPEFADHLLGPPWGDVPLHGTLRNRTRGSGSGNSHQGHLDEDARSQASGSSAASAASGASGVSSHGEPEQIYQHQEMPNKIPQYGLRNTVDIGQHHHNMDNVEKINREQRSASAPPENRQQKQEEMNQQHQPSQGNQRFISRVDITPQFNQQTDDKGSMPKPQQQQSTPTNQQQKPQQQQSNVRHIPIFVEGRDEPIIPKNINEPNISTTHQTPSSYYSAPFDDATSKFHTTPHFQRPSTFNQHGNRHRDWVPPDFYEPFDDVFGGYPGVRRPSQSAPFRQSRQQQQQQQQQQPPLRQQQQQYEKRPPHNEFNYCNTQPAGPFQSQPSAQTQQQPQQAQPSTQPPKPKVYTPKDPLEKVALVQKEVDSLTEQIKQWSGISKTDKQYIYLDEMLTRELIKLDDIETEGKENVRQARKNAIKCIQNSISLLESKVSSHQPKDESQLDNEQPIDEDQTKEMKNVPESEMSVNEDKTKNETVSSTTMPSTPTKDSTEDNIIPENEVPIASSNVQSMQLDESEKVETDVTPELKNSTMEVEETKSSDAGATQDTEANNQMQSETIETKNEENSAILSSIKSPKKSSKTKKQSPASTEPIPLPAAENNSLDVK